MADPHTTDADGLLESLKRVAVALKESDVRFALAGGYAVYARGGTNSAHDVDFVLLPADVDRATKAVTKAGLEVREPPEDWLGKAYAGEHLIDLIFELPEGPVDQAMLDRADEMAVESVLMPVLSATDLVTSKLLSLNEHACDLAPVLQMTRATREQVDWSTLSDRVADSPYAMACLDLFRRLGIFTPKRERASE